MYTLAARMVTQETIFQISSSTHPGCVKLFKSIHPTGLPIVEVLSLGSRTRTEELIESLLV